MKKIMFNDRYGLTQAVIEGRKTMTRRIVRNQEEYYELRWFQPYVTREKALYGYDDLRGGIWEVIWPAYVMHEVVAVAQSYKDLGYSDFALDRDPKDVQHVRGTLKQSAGWDNKLFVRAEAYKHRIRITYVRCERLQDISYADCLKEGIRPSFSESVGIGKYGYIDDRGTGLWFDTPRAAFASLIDKVSGKGTWDGNPWVFVYEFELLG